MSVARRIAGSTVGALAVLLATAVPGSAHGAPTAPLSRAAACGPLGGAAARTAACRAARAANGRADFADWDDVRVADVDGRDRQVIPDGKLCSAGLPAFRGLDLRRADWPVTTLTAGSRTTFTFRATIPHPGEFRFYLTRHPYDPTRPLRWSDLEPAPFLRVTDPPLRGRTYRMTGTLPKGSTGRHLIYTIWQNDGPDSYYACSDVVLQAPPRPTPTHVAAVSQALARPVAAVGEPARLGPAAAVLVGVGAAVATLGGVLARLAVRRRRS